MEKLQPGVGDDKLENTISQAEMILSYVNFASLLH